MAETPGPDSKTPAGSKAERVIKLDVAPEMSVEDIDEAILEDDPEFLNQLKEVGSDKSLSISEIQTSIDDDNLNDEKERLMRLGKISAVLVRLFPFLPRLSLKAKILARRGRDYQVAQRIRLNNFFYFLKTQGKDQAIAIAKDKISSLGHWFSSWKKFISKMTLLGRLSFFTTILLAFGMAWFIWQGTKNPILTEGEGLFITSFEKVADKVYEFDPKADLEPFFENLRGESNILMVPKMLANLQKSKSSGSLPMAAFEFYIEGWGSEGIIEFKDREVEFRDLMLRTIEEYNFDQLDSADGKKELCIKLEKVINSRLTSGQLKRVLVKTAIIKP